MPESSSPEKSGEKKSPHRRRRFRKNRTDAPKPEASSPASPAAPKERTNTGITANKPHDRSENRPQRREGRDHRSSHKGHKEKAPVWGIEESFKPTPLTDSKSDLLEILAGVDPEELMMSSLVQKKKPIPEETEGEIELPEDFEIGDGSSKVIIEMVKNCPICDKPIREIMYALHDYEHDKLAHFDCVFRKVSESLKDKLTDKRYLAYLGSGAFGIMETVSQKNNKAILVEKFYPGAPVEELLHAEENQPDEEL